MSPATTMNAVIKTKPQFGAEWGEAPIPTIGPHEVLVKVIACSICGTDVHIYEWNDWAAHRIKTPQIMGHEVAGEVVEVGNEVSSIKVGDYVSAETHIPCGLCFQCKTGKPEICRNLKILGVDTNGSFAEYMRLPEVDAWKNSRSLPPEVATVQEPLGNAIDTVLAEDIAGKTCVVVGCGPVGMFAVAVARACGATTLIATDVNEYRLSLAKKMGATHVFNPAKTDVVKEVLELTHGDGVDVMCEMSGNTTALHQGLAMITPGGRASLLGLYNDKQTIDLNTEVIMRGIRVLGITGRTMFGTWYKAARLLESGLIDPTPIITHKFPLRDYAKAMELMMSGNSGKVVLLPDSSK
jgi:threonine 3-dehydrogenase